MTEERRKLIQAILAVLLVVAAVRLALIFYERHAGGHAPQPGEAKPAVAPALPGSYYVVPRKLHAYDLKSAQQLTRQPVWVKEGYRYTFYRYAGGHADYKHAAGLLGPIERLQVRQVVRDRGPTASDPDQVLALFEKDGKTCAVPIGLVQGGDTRIYADEIFYIEDPRALYQWPPEIWRSIEAHQVKPGMDEIQAVFALGMGVPQRSDDPDIKTVVYPNAGNPVAITYRKGRAANIQPGASGR